MPSNELLKPVTPRSKAAISRQAQQFLRKHFPKLLISPGRSPMIELFEFTLDQLGIEAAVKDLPAGIEGITVPAGMPYMFERGVLCDYKHTAVVLAPEVHESLHQDGGRARFTVAHEMYHALYHVPEVEQVWVEHRTVALAREQDIPAYRNPQWQADKFAAELLMPEPAVVCLVQEYGPGLDRIMWVFGVSRMAAKIRVGEISGRWN